MSFVFKVTNSDSLMSPMPGPVMNSLVSETKVVCNEAIPNPITPVLVPIKIADENKSINILNGAHVKIEKNVKGIINNKQICNKVDKNDADNNKESAKEDCMTTDNSIESNITEPMDCNSTPNISPAHIGKCNSSNEDVAMSEASVCYNFLNYQRLIN